MSQITLPKISLDTVMRKIRAENRQQEATMNADALPKIGLNTRIHKIKAENKQQEATMNASILPKIGIDMIMHKIRAENKQQEATMNADVLPELNFNFQFNFEFSLQDQLEKLKPEEIILPNKSSYHINDFCVYHDEAFIKNSFKGLLKRLPEEEELGHYLLFLRQGLLSKKEIISKIRYSKEGREKSVQVKGLKLPTLFILIGKLPVIGFLLKTILALFRLPSLMVQIRQLEATSQVPDVKTEQLAKIMDQNLNNTFRYTLQETLQSTLENSLPPYLQVAFSQKVSRAELEMKANRSELESKAERAELESKAERAELESKAERSELESKAERSELESKAERSELASKVSRAELEHKVDYISLSSLLEGKVSHQDLDKKLELRVAHTDFIKELALRVDYDSLAINLATKADQNKMNEAFTYIEKNTTQLTNQKTQLSDYKIQLSDYKVNLIDNQRRLNLLLEEARKRLPKPFSEKQIETIAKQDLHIFDAMYVAFEDKFRGTRKDIKQRQKVYLPIIKKALQATDNNPVLDMGCGRGEWLELLQEHHIKAQGTDLNCIMIQECNDHGLVAKEADILDYLREFKPASVSAVTGFHIIEHLPFNALIALFDECLRVLKPGGAIIFETPNPENLLVGGCHFYTDPSHHNPLVPETMRFTIEQRGFEKTEIKRLHKYSDFYETTSDDEFIKAHFYNEMDFAIIGHKV